MRSLLLIVVFAGSLMAASAQDSLSRGLLDINGTQLYVNIVGTGDTILVIHGGPGLSHQYLLPHFTALAKTHTLIFYDQRSSGQSQLSVKSDMNFATFADDIEALRKHFNLRKLHILAHSWGALVASTYALNYPEQVQSLVYVCPVPHSKTLAERSNKEAAARSTPADSAAKSAILTSDAFRNGDVQPIEDLMKISFRLLFCDTANLAKLDPSLPPTYLVASLSMYGFVDEMAKYDFFPKMKDISIPTLIIRGSCDISPEEADTRLQGCFTNASVVTFKKSGHFPFIEQNKSFTKTVNRFYSQLN